jgi:hypothetical protein
MSTEYTISNFTTHKTRIPLNNNLEYISSNNTVYTKKDLFMKARYTSAYHISCDYDAKIFVVMHRTVEHHDAFIALINE